jgi:hypothetical protein
VATAVPSSSVTLREACERLVTQALEGVERFLHDELDEVVGAQFGGELRARRT